MSHSLTQLLHNKSASEDTGIYPVFFRLSLAKDRTALEMLLIENPSICSCDRIQLQLGDLVKLENPSRILSVKDVEQLIEEKVGDLDSNQIGVWVYYSWRNLIVHILDKEDFVRVRTIRNAYKITFEEQELLATKKIGIIGLSVGQSVSLALAMERIGGELRIADFDYVELSNLNRIRTGVSNLGLSKTAIIAREIAEIDPFLKVTCFSEGITPNNIDAFFDEGGMLDLLVEECDSVEIKVLARQQAKKRGIPVIMDTSDKGMIDVERFDLDKNYPLLHGLIDESISYAFLKSLKSSEEKLPFILPIISTDTLSVRFKGSGLEVGKTITTWPQLASDVIIGGGICANVAKRIMLNRPVASGRTWFDIDEMLCGNSISEDRKYKFEMPVSEGRMDEIFSKLKLRMESTISSNDLSRVVESALLAPSAGNNQKWKWYFREGCLLLFLDKNAEFAFGDNLNIASYINSGCALENLVLAASNIGYKTHIDQNSLTELFPLVAIIYFEQADGTKYFQSNLAEYIPERYTNRSRIAIRPMQLQETNQLRDSWNSEIVRLHLVSDRIAIKSLSELVCFGDRFRLTNLQGHQEFFMNEIRWTVDESQNHRDGLDISLLNLSEMDMAGLRIARDLKAIEFVNSFNGGSGFEKISASTFDCDCIIGMVTSDDYNPTSLIECGRQVERNWLNATKLGIGYYPITVLPMMFSFLESDRFGFNSKEKLEELNRMKCSFDVLFPNIINEKLLFFFRLMIADKPNRMSLRKPIFDKLVLR